MCLYQKQNKTKTSKVENLYYTLFYHTTQNCSSMTHSTMRTNYDGKNFRKLSEHILRERLRRSKGKLKKPQKTRSFILLFKRLSQISQ